MKYLPDLVANAGSARLAGQEDGIAALLEIFVQKLGLRRLTAAVGALKGNENTQLDHLLF
jgi:hypothetical protein